MRTKVQVLPSQHGPGNQQIEIFLFNIIQGGKLDQFVFSFFGVTQIIVSTDLG
jgi:hypothetical protein